MKEYPARYCEQAGAGCVRIRRDVLVFPSAHAEQRWSECYGLQTLTSAIYTGFVMPHDLVAALTQADRDGVFAACDGVGIAVLVPLPEARVPSMKVITVLRMHADVQAAILYDWWEAAAAAASAACAAETG